MSSTGDSDNNDDPKKNNNTLYVAASAAAASDDTSSSNKDYKICDVLGGLDVTRLISTNTRNFFRGAIDDAELLREFMAEATRTASARSTSPSDFASLQEMANSLDWKARGVSPNTTTLDLNLGYTDDRSNRRIDRFVGLTNQPLVGTKETDFFMMDGLSSLFPWVVDRRSREEHWWLDHIVGRSEGRNKEPFAFDLLYSGAWLISYGDSLLYYPPLTVYQHPLTFGDRVGTYWDSHTAPFSKPNFPDQNPLREAFFSKPYPDTAVPGLSLVSAIAPVYYTGEFRNYTYNDTYVASLGVDIATSSISSFLDVLEDSLTPGSFGLLVDADLSVIVISQEVVKRIYPPRTGMEESRVTRNPDGTIASDRRNQTYLPSDTILQDLTLLDNADWKGLKAQIDERPKGVRDFTTLDILLTNDSDDSSSEEEKEPIEYYVMFERWQYVADWTLLVFAPTQEVEDAIDVVLVRDDYVPTVLSSTATTTEAALDNNITTSDEEETPNKPTIYLEGMKGGPALKAQGARIVNNGNLDVKVSTKKIPDWISLHVNNDDTDAMTAIINGGVVLLKAGESLSIDFDVITNDLDVGTQSSALTFQVKDADYPDCFFRQDLTLPVTVRVQAMDCPGDHSVFDNTVGGCVCDGSSIQMPNGDCIQTVGIVLGVMIGVLVLLCVGLWYRNRQKRLLADRIWQIDSTELVYGEDPLLHVIGEGSFGSVVLAEYRGTTVAVKRMHNPKPTNKKRTGGVGRRGSNFSSGSGGMLDFSTRRSSVGGNSSDLMEFGAVLPEQHPGSNGGMMDESSMRNSIIKENDSNHSTRRRSSVMLGNSGSIGKADFVKEMRLLSRLRHPNITTVMGAIIPDSSNTSKNLAPPVRSIVMEYMDNGSLHDCLQRAVELDGEMIISILQNVTKGLQFLHYTKPKAIMHGDLKSANILLDANFKAKLTDFGLATVSSSSSSGARVGGNFKPGKQRTGSVYWMSPELLRGETGPTPASDIYSLGCVLYEIYARKIPYEGEGDPPRVVLEEVCDPHINRRPPKPFAMPQGVAALMHDCLVAEADERPSLEEISSRLKRFHDEDVDPVGLVKKSKGGDTKDFELLLQLFPRHIAEALRDGRPVEPEQHDCATIFFSDIVGFTTISSSLEPQKVSNMLHRLFLRMDAIADEHELYKVETIGDAWMGCTNCVKSQDNDHAKRIAEFSVDAMQAASETLIDLEDPERGYVQIRVGFHSGPVYTNVIGSRNPHYTLFGDTVNTASRMESNSIAGRIQCSEAAATLVMKQAPNINVTCRGKIPVKGKGEMTTYWIGDYIEKDGEMKLVSTKISSGEKGESKQLDHQDRGMSPPPPPSSPPPPRRASSEQMQRIHNQKARYHKQHFKEYHNEYIESFTDEVII